MTSAPPSVLSVFASLLRSRVPSNVDLRSIRSLIVGAEPIDHAALTNFEDLLAPHGLHPRALCPAYGLAEATLAVSITSPDELWTSRVVEGSRLASSGPPLDGVAVDSLNGHIRVDSPSVASVYLTAEGATPITCPMITSDIGLVHDGHLFVRGRSDDVIFVGGRNVYPADIERAVRDPSVVSCVALALSDTEYALVCESRRRADPTSIEKAARQCALQAVGLAPAVVEIVPVGYVPRTPSGKPKRVDLAQRLRREAVE
jgi:fatty-acyl-CoA synthase